MTTSGEPKTIEERMRGSEALLLACDTYVLPISEAARLAEQHAEAAVAHAMKVDAKGWHRELRERTAIIDRLDAARLAAIAERDAARAEVARWRRLVIRYADILAPRLNDEIDHVRIDGVGYRALCAVTQDAHFALDAALSPEPPTPTTETAHGT